MLIVSSGVALLNDLILVEFIRKFSGPFLDPPGTHEWSLFCLSVWCHQAFPVCSCYFRRWGLSSEHQKARCSELSYNDV